MLSILRPEFLEEPAVADDPVPGTLCYFMETPARLCPFVIMDISTKEVFAREHVREEYYYDDLEKCPVLTYGYDASLMWLSIPSRRWRQFGMDPTQDDYEIIWPDDVYGRLSIRIAGQLGLPREYPLGRKVHGHDWVD